MREAMAQIMAGLYRRVMVVGFDATAGHLEAGDVQLTYGLSFDAEMDGMAGATAVTLVPAMAETAAHAGADATEKASRPPRIAFLLYIIVKP